MVRTLTTVGVPTAPFAESFVAVGVVFCGSVLSGFPSPSVSGFNGLVPSVISVALVIPSLSQSKTDHVEYTELKAVGVIVNEQALFGLVPLASSNPLVSPS